MAMRADADARIAGSARRGTVPTCKQADRRERRSQTRQTLSLRPCACSALHRRAAVTEASHPVRVSGSVLTMSIAHRSDAA